MGQIDRESETHRLDQGNPQGNEGGFTLVEMVVTVTIVLVVAATALLAAPGIIRSAMTSSCDAAAGSISNAINASYAEHGDYTRAEADDLVADGFLVAGPQPELFTIDSASAEGVLVEFGSQCVGETAPATWGADAQADGSYQFGTSAACAAGEECALGDTGPGGGKVFYVDDDGEGFVVGPDEFRYLEVAPPGWNGGGSDPLLEYGCAENVPNTALGAVGGGKINTASLLAAAAGVCASDLPEAAQAAAGYAGGGKSDWYLPAEFEINQLCRWVSGQSTGPDHMMAPCGNSGSLAYGITPEEPYWSSTSAGQFLARYLEMGTVDAASRSKDLTGRVRPIRAFAPTP